MEDKSILKNTDTIDVNATYINDCIKEVCLNGDSLTKYKRMIEKQYGAEFYQKCSNFVKGIRLSVKRKKFTQTSLTNLRYLANEINIRPDTIDAIVNYYTKTFIDEEVRPIEEETTLMSTIAEEERKKLELEEERKKEEERERKAEERRKRVEERRREKEREEKRLREEQFKLLKKEEEETKRKEEEDDKKGAIGCGIIIAIIIALRLVSSSESFEEVLGIIIVFGFFGFIYYIFKD